MEILGHSRIAFTLEVYTAGMTGADVRQSAS
jgi:hypothetical protein